MNQKEEKSTLARRDFLKVATVGAVVGAVAVASKDATAKDVTLNENVQGGYSETTHVAKYYELARI